MIIRNVKTVHSLVIGLLSAGVCALSAVAGHAALLPELESYTQPSAELVMPFDATTNKATFLAVSNVNPVTPTGLLDASTEKVTTHWAFWSETCNELFNFSICLTKNDTVVVDPRDLQEVGPDNKRSGPKGNLDGQKGIVTVVAYETDDKCTPFGIFPPDEQDGKPGVTIADDVLVGAFTIADTAVGYSFGNDALGLGTESFDLSTHVALPAGNDVSHFDIQTVNPTQLGASLVMLTHLRATNVENGIVLPSGTPLNFSVDFFDNQEIRVSLPDVGVRCALFSKIVDGIAPDSVTLASAGFVRLIPKSIQATDYLWGFHGMAVGKFGASVSVKAVNKKGSASVASVDP